MTILGKTIVAILLVGGIGGGVFYAANFMKNDTPITEERMTTQSDVVSIEESVGSEDVEGKIFTDKDMSFRELMKKTGSYECTVKQSVAAVTTEGKVSIKGENISAKFLSSVQGQTFETSMIAKGGYVYTWSNITPTSGVKTKIPSGATSSGSKENSTATYSWDGKDIGSYSCVVANIPESVFSLPTTITFTEVTQ